MLASKELPGVPESFSYEVKPPPNISKAYRSSLDYDKGEAPLDTIVSGCPDSNTLDEAYICECIHG